MPKRILDSPEALKDLVGQEIAITDWFNITQERIQQFADATLDHQWIHLDVERARRGKFRAFSFRETTPELRQRYFHPAEDGWELDPAVRALVEFIQSSERGVVK